MSDAIIGRIDEMGNRIDDLEKSIEELMAQVDCFPRNFCWLVHLPDYTNAHRPE